MRILKYMIFLVAVLAFMVFLGHKETLSPEETTAIVDFQNMVAREQTTPVAAASESPVIGQISTAPPSATSSSEPIAFLDRTIPNGTVLEDSVNVRSAPGLDFPVVTQLYKGDRVIIGENVNGWYELLLDGRKYYISADFVSLSPIQ